MSTSFDEMKSTKDDEKVLLSLFSLRSEMVNNFEKLTIEMDKHGEDISAVVEGVTKMVSSLDEVNKTGQRAAVLIKQTRHEGGALGAAVVSLSSVAIPPNMSQEKGSWCGRCFKNVHDPSHNRIICAQSASRQCYKCRRPGHPSAVCPLRLMDPETAVCKRCNMLGHWAEDNGCGLKAAYKHHVKILSQCCGGLLPTIAKQLELRYNKHPIYLQPMKYYSCLWCAHICLRPGFNSVVRCPYCHGIARLDVGKITW